MPFRTNGDTTSSDGGEAKLLRQLAPGVLPGSKQPGGSRPNPPALQEDTAGEPGK